jgi:hypothetical protein
MPLERRQLAAFVLEFHSGLNAVSLVGVKSPAYAWGGCCSGA